VAGTRSQTPAHLAERILRERSSLEGERRTVTVLFADAVGYTPLSEQLGEEEVYGLTQGCTARMVEAVHRFEGTVTQFAGDGIIALFGAPIAHEDSARRAVAAALAMQRSLEDYAGEIKRRHRVECRFRVGLNTGPVVVGKISDDLDMDYTAIGDTVNLAARMEAVAEPGTVFITEETHRAVADYFDCEHLGALSVKGKAEPVVVHRVMREMPARTRLEASAERGLTPFTGRSQELSTLTDLLEHLRRGQGQVAFVSGEAGIGKSRLLLELRRSIGGREVNWLEGHCVSYGKNMPYLPLVDLVKANAGVQEGDDDTTIIGRLEQAAAAWDEPARATVPYLRYLLSVPTGDGTIDSMDPQERRAGILDGLRALLTQESGAQPLILVIEDLHWIDEQTEEALTALADVVARAPILLVLTHRPGYTHSLGDRSYYNRLTLRHLAPQDSAAMASHVLQGGTLPSALAQVIVSKAEGNPFFIEEVTKSLVETGALRRSNGSYVLNQPIDQVLVPNTIQEVILSRIDRLEVEARQAIQLASVIGREFTVRLLDRISNVEAQLDSALGELKGLELIYEKAYFPELSYMFKHALTHEVALSTLLVERRRALHRIVGEGIEALYPDRLAEHYEALAHHYHESQSWEKALDYLEKAGEKAGAAYANQDAIEYYGRALEVCQRLGDDALAASARVAEKQLWVYFTIGDFGGGRKAAASMLAASRGLGDRQLEGKALASAGMVESFGHEFEQAEEILLGALALADEYDIAETKFLATVWLIVNSSALGDLERFERLEQEAEVLLTPGLDPFARWWPPFERAVVAGWYGHFGEGLEIIGRLRDAAEQAQMIALTGNGWWEGLLRAGRGEYEEALAAWNNVLSFCERTGEMFMRLRVVNSVGWVYVELNDYERALEWNRRGTVEAAAAGFPDPECESNARLNMGDALLALGRLDEAEEQFAHVERIVRNPQPHDRWALWSYAQHLCHSYGELCLARQEFGTALSYADECIERAEATGRKKNVVKGRRLRGQALFATGDLAAAEGELLAALEIAKEIGNPPQLWKTYIALGELREKQGKVEESRAAYRDALSVIENVAAALTDESLRETFLTSNMVQRVRQAGGRP